MLEALLGALLAAGVPPDFATSVEALDVPAPLLGGATSGASLSLFFLSTIAGKVGAIPSTGFGSACFSSTVFTATSC